MCAKMCVVMHTKSCDARHILRSVLNLSDAGWSCEGRSVVNGLSDAHDRRLGTTWSNKLHAGTFLGGYLLHYVNDASLFGRQPSRSSNSTLGSFRFDLAIFFQLEFSSMMEPN